MFPGITVAFWKFIPALLTIKLEPTLGSVNPYGKIISIFAAFNNLWEIVKDIVILVILYTPESSGKIFIFEIENALDKTKQTKFLFGWLLIISFIILIKRL